jgi:general secretion pathway protein M
MKNRFLQLVQKFYLLSDRERILISIGGVATAVLMFQWLIWQPINDGLEKNKQSIAQKEELLDWVQKNANKAQQIKGITAGKQAFRGSLAQLVNQSATRLNISITRMQPQQDQLSVWIDEILFNDLLSWLQGLEKQGVTIVELDVNAQSESGYVKVRRLILVA